MPTTPAHVRQEICEDLEALSQAAARRFVALSQTSVAARGVFHVALAGGDTPRRLYQVLASPGMATQIPWPAVQVYFGDERAVPCDHPDSNARMAREALLDHVPIPQAQIHVIEADPAYIRQGASRYARLLASHLPLSARGFPVFDLILLGIGEDGHTASLFPHSCILHDTSHAVAAVYVDRLRAWRISLTLPTLNSARQVWVLASGAGKSDVVARVFGAKSAKALPVQRLSPAGELRWYLDKAAASLLSAGSPC